jgi:hypothetical protein
MDICPLKLSLAHMEQQLAYSWRRRIERIARGRDIHPVETTG